MKGFDELWMPESEDMLGSSSDWAEGDGEVWQPEREPREPQEQSTSFACMAADRRRGGGEQETC